MNGASPKTSAPSRITSITDHQSAYNQFQKDLERWVNRLPKGALALKLGHKAEEAIKNAVASVSLRHNPEQIEGDGRGGYGSSLIFEEMGPALPWAIDGHNLPLLISFVGVAKTCDTPSCCMS